MSHLIYIVCSEEQSSSARFFPCISQNNSPEQSPIRTLSHFKRRSIPSGWIVGSDSEDDQTRSNIDSEEDDFTHGHTTTPISPVLQNPSVVTSSTPPTTFARKMARILYMVK